MESSQSCAATLTHYSTEPLTPGPDSTTLDTGNELISRMAAENKRRWEEMITSTDL